MFADLVSFLQARFDEDESAATNWPESAIVSSDGCSHSLWIDTIRHPGQHTQRRALAEVKKNKLALGVAHCNLLDDNEDETAWYLLCVLALPYADHLDYKLGWHIDQENV